MYVLLERDFLSMVPYLLTEDKNIASRNNLDCLGLWGGAQIDGFFTTDDSMDDAASLETRPS